MGRPAAAARRTRVWRPDWPCPVGRGALAPSPRTRLTRPIRRTPDGAIWRGIRTPEGTATLRIEADPAAGTVTARGLGRRGRLGARPAARGCWAPTTTRAGFEPLHPADRGRLAPAPPLAARGDRPGDGVAGAGRSSSRRSPARRPSRPSARWCTASANGPRARRASRSPSVRLWVQPSPERAARDPLVGVAAAARRRRPVAPDPARRPGRARPGAGRSGRRPRSSTGGCARCPASGSGRAPRCVRGRWATPTR